MLKNNSDSEDNEEQIKGNWIQQKVILKSATVQSTNPPKPDQNQRNIILRTYKNYLLKLEILTRYKKWCCHGLIQTFGMLRHCPWLATRNDVP